MKLIVVVPEKTPSGGAPGLADRTIRNAAESSSLLPAERTMATDTISPDASTVNDTPTDPTSSVEIRWARISRKTFDA